MNTEKIMVNFVYYLRMFAVICIFLCHLVQESSNLYIKMSAQLFNIGVQIFFIISGFCFGVQGEINDCHEWYIKRLKRIYVPYELFLCTLAAIYLVQKRSFSAESWIFCIGGMQGSKVGVLGADHTWFLSSLLLCYAITPFLLKLYYGMPRKKNIIVLSFFCGHVIFSMIPYPPFYILLSPICFYSIAYYMGYEYKREKVSAGTAKVAFVIVCLALLIRVAGRAFWDGSIWYDRVIVGYTQYIAAFGIMVLFMFLFDKVRPIYCCKFICSISFEIYLCHYMFIVGPVSLMAVTRSVVINTFLVIAATLIVAVVLNKVGKIILRVK